MNKEELFREIDKLTPDDMVAVVRYTFSSIVENDAKPSEDIVGLTEELMDLANDSGPYEERGDSPCEGVYLRSE